MIPDFHKHWSGGSDGAILTGVNIPAQVGLKGWHDVFTALHVVKPKGLQGTVTE